MSILKEMRGRMHRSVGIYIGVTLMSILKEMRENIYRSVGSKNNKKKQIILPLQCLAHHVN